MTSEGSTIAVPPGEVHALAATLTALAGDAEDAAARFTGGGRVGSRLQSAVEDFLGCHRTAAGALAAELRWLGTTIAAVADSWTDLDDSVLGTPGRPVPR